MDRNKWKKVVGWFREKIQNNFWAKWGYIPIIMFYPNSLKFWFREYAPEFLPNFVTDIIFSIPIVFAVIYIPLLLIDYLEKTRK
ncbi:hypothetical protein XBJ2_1610041 [Xenorhabdus bovienii str. Jollieti]|uniref:Uncharacterized protein n=1 Tax=Xenorhabdus bovienii (strain SS-2004) TaxID=406818 RepID=D3V3J6_XENBS|nr:hypothetical protein [Xenorhabdus bovienii]CBJ82225.1 hypothetical protein XBJ1_3102 [Xenorhabdus bovienii SS-2004]CDH28084.1 hypothetical protein XBJ2_1610041 [Xenorhabdus bovienii str. Jollieti]